MHSRTETLSHKNIVRSLTPTVPIVIFGKHQMALVPKRVASEAYALKAPTTLSAATEFQFHFNTLPMRMYIKTKFSLRD